MDRRTYEGPMDWEYQDHGPFDPTSPFTHAAKSNSQNGELRPCRILKSGRPQVTVANLLRRSLCFALKTELKTKSFRKLGDTFETATTTIIVFYSSSAKSCRAPVP